ncbi:hypothetical protein EI94DRAFT_1683362 [Lactarius quietus]|nr:hypothetical protein EI94DRAFT_1683362 [Lactarius quietus]
MLVSPIRIFATLAVAAAAGVSAQSLDSCITTCLTNSQSSSTCPSFTDVTCVCSNTAFQAAAAACLKANCTTADQESAQQLQQAECGSSSNSTNTTSSSTTPSGSSASPSSTTTKTGGAVRDQVPFLNAAIAFATVALGGALVL